MNDSRELLIGVVAVVGLAADIDSFTLRQVLLGLLLFLFLLGHWHQLGSTYDQIVYAAVAGCCGLLALGFPVQELLAANDLAHKSEEGFVVAWVLVAICVFFARKMIRKAKEES